MLEVRRLRGGDERLYHRMLDLYEQAFEDQESYGSARPFRAYVADRLKDEGFVSLVGLAGEQVVGALAAYELKKFEQERSELYIYDLAVDERWRRQGVATALIEWLQHHARTIGAWVIFVQADPPDAPAVALYEKLGHREEVLHFDIAPTAAGTD